MQKGTQKQQLKPVDIRSITPRSHRKPLALTTNNATTHIATIEHNLQTCSQNTDRLNLVRTQCKQTIKECTKEDTTPNNPTYKSAKALIRELRTTLTTKITQQQQQNDALAQKIADLTHERTSIQATILACTRLCKSLHTQLGSYSPPK